MYRSSRIWLNIRHTLTYFILFLNKTLKIFQFNYCSNGLNIRKNLNRTVSKVDLVIMRGHVLDLVVNTAAIGVLCFQILINIKVTDVTHNLDMWYTAVNTLSGKTLYCIIPGWEIVWKDYITPLYRNVTSSDIGSTSHDVAKPLSI
jgi:hypothetical protein